MPFFRERNILCTVELQLSVFLNQNISTLLTFGVKINTFKEAEWQNPAVLAGYLQDIKERKNAQCIWKNKSWHFNGVLMDSSRWFFWKNALPLGMLHNECGIILHLPIVKNVIS